MGIGQPANRDSWQGEPQAVLTGGVYRAIFDQSRDGIIVADDEGTYLEANSSACAIFGVEPGGLYGRSVGEFAAEGRSNELWTLPNNHATNSVRRHVG